MGKSSPTKWQLKHIPTEQLLALMRNMQNISHGNTTHFSDLVLGLCPPIPEKLLWRKLQTMEDRGLIESYGPAGLVYRVMEVL